MCIFMIVTIINIFYYLDIYYTKFISEIFQIITNITFYVHFHFIYFFFSFIPFIGLCK